MSKFFVFVCIFFFVLLMALRQDELILWNYWTVFLPLWLWKLVAVIGGMVGTIVWYRNPLSRQDGLVQFKAMILSVCLQCLLLVFEMLACDKLESLHQGRASHMWLFVFIPMILLSIVSIGICIWALKNERGFEFELTCSCNILFFIFLALRLDKLIQWNWAVIFIPLWIVMSVAIILVIYGIILALILIKSPEVLPEARRNSVSSALAFAAVVFPLLIFEILFAQKLDNQINSLYITVCAPLLLAIAVLAVMSFGARTSNYWWFGIRKDFCQFLLEACPPLQEYANIEIKLKVHSRSNVSHEDFNSNELEIDEDISSRPTAIADKEELCMVTAPSIVGQPLRLVTPHVLRIDVPD